MNRFQKNWVFCIALLASAAVGCGGSGPSISIPKLYPVKGKVFVNGTAAEGARVIFHRSSGTVEFLPEAVVEADGSFSVKTLLKEGAPEGEYGLQLTWTPMTEESRHKAEDMGPELLPTKYLHQDTSGIKVTVKPEENSVPDIQITAP